MLNKKLNEFHPIAIVGMGAIFPGSNNIQQFWKNIVTANDLITTIPATHWLIDDYYDPDPRAIDKTYCKRGGFIPDIEFDPLDYGIPPNNILVTDNSQLLALVVAKQVLQDAIGPTYQGKDLSRVSVILGTSALTIFQFVAARMQRPIWTKVLRDAGLDEVSIQNICDHIANHYQNWQENTFPGLLPNVVAGRVANRFNLGGTNCTIDAACASSFAALSMAVDELHLKTADMVITGGVDTLNDIIMYMCFSKTHALSLSGDCRPFSNKADGTILGEGIGMFALKRLEDAEKDEDKIYAVIRGIGSSSDGRSKSIYAPDYRGQKKAILKAYQLAGYAPHTVELMEGHGTGTQAGDIAEFTALQQAFSESVPDNRRDCALGSVKSQIGHTKCAAGAAGLFKIAMALHHKVLPPTIKIEQPNPNMDIHNSPFYLNTELRPWIKNYSHPRRASASAFGFGGSNFHITLEEYTGPHQAKRLRTAPAELILLTAEDPKALVKLGEKYLQANEKTLTNLARISQESYEPHHLARLAIIAADYQDLQNQIIVALNHIKDHPQQALLTRKNIHYGYALDPGRVAFLFPGQGSQYVKMGADIAMTFSQSAAIWESASKILSSLEKPLHDIVFPQPVFTEELRQQQYAELIKTQYAQPALAVTSLMYLNLLKDLAIRPDCVAGHSFGELTALYASGAIDADTLLLMAKKRGELMQNAGNVPGAMISVLHPVEHVLEIIKNAQLPVTPANFNGPKQVVLSGTLENTIIAEQYLQKQKIKFQRLPVAEGFHSQQVAKSSKSFFEYLKTIAWQTLQIPVYSNATATPYLNPNIASHLAQQIVQPVRFQEMLENIYQTGVRTFVEVGPSAVLSGLVSQCLMDKPCYVIPLNERHHNAIVSLWNGLGKLFAIGFNPMFSSLWQDYGYEKEQQKDTSRHFITLNGASYGKLYPSTHTQRVPPHSIEKVPPKQEAQTDLTSSISSLTDLRGQSIMSDNKSTALPHETLQQLVEAHNFYQKTMAEAHIAFLNSLTQIGAPLTQNKEVFSSNLVPQASKQVPSASFPSPTHIFPPPSSPKIESYPSDMPTNRQEIHYAGHSITAISTAEGQLPTSSLAPPSPISNQEQAAPPIQDISSFEKDSDSLEDFLFRVIEDKTGYPRSMLKPEMAIEADLGIDSIKRVEILSALTERLPKVPDFDLQRMAEIQTIGDILTFMKQYQLDLAS
jgi:polyketide-type polyunsaturated fatty acid synthase PfaA